MSSLGGYVEAVAPMSQGTLGWYPTGLMLSGGRRNPLGGRKGRARSRVAGPNSAGPVVRQQNAATGGLHPNRLSARLTVASVFRRQTIVRPYRSEE